MSNCTTRYIVVKHYLFLRSEFGPIKHTPHNAPGQILSLDTTGLECNIRKTMDRRELEVTAELAHLELNDDELESLGAAVSRVVEYFSLMQSVDVSDLEPTTHVLLDKNRLRSDQPNDAVDREALLDNAPEVEDRFILVPNVL